LRSKYFGDLVWTTVLFIAILASVLAEYLPYILSGTAINLKETISRASEESFSNLYGFIRHILLGDLAVFMYGSILVLVVVRESSGRRLDLRRDLGFVFSPRGPWELAISILLSTLWILLVVPISLTTGLGLYSIIYPLYPVAISEEVLFRGLILGRLIPRDLALGRLEELPRAMPAVLVSSLYFTLVHIPLYMVQGNTSDLFLVFIYGIVSGVTYVLTGGILPAVLIHWLTDYVALSTLELI